jgi:hypothetical protein
MSNINAIFDRLAEAMKRIRQLEIKEYAKYSDNIVFTELGGIAVWLENNTPAATEAGRLVKADPANDDAVVFTALNDTECIGVFLEDGIASGESCWVVISGRAVVLFDDNHGPTSGDVVYPSEAGYAGSHANVPINQLIGWSIQTVAAGGAGTHVYGRCILNPSDMI